MYVQINVQFNLSMPANKLSPAAFCCADHKDLILPNTSDDKCPAYCEGVVIPKLNLLNLSRFIACFRRLTAESVVALVLELLLLVVDMFINSVDGTPLIIILLPCVRYFFLFSVSIYSKVKNYGIFHYRNICWNNNLPEWVDLSNDKGFLLIPNGDLKLLGKNIRRRVAGGVEHPFEVSSAKPRDGCDTQ